MIAHKMSTMDIISMFTRSWPVKLSAITDALNIKVFRVPLSEDISGKFSREMNKDGTAFYTIHVNSKHPFTRQRFTLAHEIAHYVLHRDLIDEGVVDTIMYRSKELDDYFEVQANQFAADLIMPPELVVKAYEEQKDPEELAKMFEVSLRAMEIRLNTLTKVGRIQKAA